MTSPFASLENAVIQFSRNTGGISRDNDGNPVPIVQILPVTAILKQQKYKTASKTDRIPGVDQSAIALEGWCINPVRLPDNVSPDRWYQCRWNGTEGWIYIEGPIGGDYGQAQGIGAIVNDATGTKISGVFQLRKLV